MSRVTTTGGLELELRGYEPADRPFICTSWAKGARAQPPGAINPNRRIPERIWSTHQAAHMARCLERSTCVVAHQALGGERVGWCAAEAQGGALVVHWVYVENALRTLGAARALLQWLSGYLLDLELSAAPLVATQWPAAHRWIAEKLPALSYDPYLVAEAS